MDVSLWCEEVEEEPGQEPEAQVHEAGPSLRRAPWDPSVSGGRVIQRLLQVEDRYLPSVLYVALVQREPERREELAKWALEVPPHPASCFLLLCIGTRHHVLYLPLQVCCESGCDEAVFPLSVSLMDRFLSASLSLPVSPCLLAAGCVLIASKLTDSESIVADMLCAAAEYRFLSSDLWVSWTALKYTAVLI